VKIWRLELHTRVFAQGGTGKNWARESSLYFAQANPEEMMDNKYVRSKGIVPDAWAGSFGPDINHFQYGGGLNLRGYAGYYIAENDKYGNVVKAYRGTSGWSANAELDFDRIIPWHPKKLGQWFDFDTYLFADAGMLRYQNSQLGKEWSKLRADAGVGATFTIKKFWALQGFKPITIRFDMPFYVSDAPFQEGSNTKFRWMFGINRAF
jgi:aminopeptidase N